MSESSAAAARRVDIVRAATEVFLRYGYARTTMSDIARAAGLTRPTLYLTFPDKEHIFAAVLETLADDKLTEIRKGLPRRKSLEAKLHYACMSWAAEAYEIVKAHPDAVDMFDFRFPTVCASYTRFAELLADLLAAPLQASGLPMSPLDAARTIAFATRGFKEIAASSADMRRLTEHHVKLVARALEPEPVR